jgi:hypothetical protein
VRAESTATGNQVSRGSGVYLASTPSGAVPRRVVVDGKRLSRFMDLIYLDRPCEKLGWKKIQVLNEVRRPLLDQDGVGAVNMRLRRAIAQAVNLTGAGDVLEWGCGFHPMRGLLDAERYAGVDIDPAVIAHNRERLPELTWYSADTDLADIPDESQDAVVSAFVFHFRLTRSHILTMRRTLRQAGFVVANMYRRSAGSRRELAAMFESAGLRVHREKDPAGLCVDHEVWCLARDDHPDPTLATRVLRNVVAGIARADGE